MPRINKQYKDQVLVKLVGTIGKMLRYYREEAKLSQNKLAKISGVSISTINEIENCIVNDMRLSTISTLSQILKIDPLKLMHSGNLFFPEDDKKDFRICLKVLDRISRRLY